MSEPVVAPNGKGRGPWRRVGTLLTLIALIGVVVIFATVLIGNWEHKHRPTPPDVVLRKDLRSIATAQENNYAVEWTYRHPDSLPDFTPSSGVEVMEATFDEDDWSAVLRHEPSGLLCGGQADRRLDWCGSRPDDALSSRNRSTP